MFNPGTRPVRPPKQDLRGHQKVSNQNKYFNSIFYNKKQCKNSDEQDINILNEDKIRITVFLFFFCFGL